jgi:hypothetical protein
MAVSTSYTVEQFLAATRATIQARGIPSGLEEIRRHVEHLLANPTLLQDYIVATNFLSHCIHWDYGTSDAANGGAFAPVSRGAAAGCVPQSLRYVP